MRCASTQQLGRGVTDIGCGSTRRQDQWYFHSTSTIGLNLSRLHLYALVVLVTPALDAYSDGRGKIEL